MKIPLDLPSGVRTALACCVLSCALAPGLLAWSANSTTEEARRVERLQHQRMSTERQLAEHLDSAAAIEQALRLLTELQPLDVSERASAAGLFQEPDKRWREHTILMETNVLHEESLLNRLTAWQARSPIQHQIRACRLQRAEDGLFASCRLAMLEPVR